jgi:hypothetical protein
VNYTRQQKAAWGTKVIDRLAAVDDLLRHPDDQPTIGLLLCRKKNKLVAEYALRGSIPTIEEIEAKTRPRSASRISFANITAQQFPTDTLHIIFCPNAGKLLAAPCRD